MKYRSKRSKVSKKSLVWIIAAFIVAALGYILYRFSLLREGQETTGPPADTTAPTAPPADTTAPPADTTAPPATTAPTNSKRDRNDRITIKQY